MVEAGTAAGMVEVGTAAGTTEKFISDGDRIHLFEPLEPRLDPGSAGCVNYVRGGLISPRANFLTAAADVSPGVP
jgi:hypothetical protein